MPYNPIALSRTQSDSDVSTFLADCVTAGTTLNATQQTAIYNLVGGLKWGNLWSKMTAIYPFVGGTAGCHAINLKTPGTYNITWGGVVTHNSNGITGNGSTGYGDTGLAPSVIGQNSAHVSVYSRTNSTEAKYSIRSAGATPTSGITPMWSDNKAYFSINSAVEDSLTVLDSTGLYTATRISSSLLGLFKGSRKIINSTRASVTPSTFSIYLLASNNVGTASNFSSRNYSFFSIGSGLTDSEAQLFSSIVQSYQTTLSRAV